MAIEGLSKEQLEQHEKVLLDRMPLTDAIGNVTLRTELIEIGWGEPLY